MSQLINIDKNFLKSSVFAGGGFAPGDTGRLSLLTDGIIPATDGSIGALQVNNLDNGFTLTFNTKGSSKITISEVVLHLTDASNAKPQICTITTHKKGGALLELVQETSLTAGPNRFVFNNPNHPISRVSVIFTSGQFQNSTFCILGELEFFGQDLISDFEFNDSVLETKAWNSSRYDGRQLQASEINVSRKSDSGNNDRTPIIQKYTRNIYIGNKIVKLDREPNQEDTTLVQFKDFSYVQTNKYITINDDDSISVNILDDTNNDDFSIRRGYYRSFYEDFPIKGRCQLILLDDSVEANLKSAYPIYFNGGQLKKLVRYQPDKAKGVDNPLLVGNIKHITGSAHGSVDTFEINKFTPANVDIANDNLPTFFNTELLQDFYPTFAINEVEGTGASAGTDFALLKLNELILEGLVYGGKLTTWQGTGGFSFLKSNITSSAYNGDKRLFVSFVKNNLDEPIHSVISGSIQGSEIKRTGDLGELSTNEIMGVTGDIDSDTIKFTLSEKIKIQQNLTSMLSSPTISDFQSGSALISITDDSNPSLLLPIKKDTTLPNGVGDKPFVIIPSNLHPFIKDNLTHFLIKAGIDIGDRKETPVLREKNKSNVRPQLTPEQMRARMLARLAAFEAERERNMLPREERRRRRQERREDRQERREERRENRQERREDRQERRRNRRRNRRRRR